MFRTTTGWVVSPTDLVDTLECDHRSALKTALAARLPGAPAPDKVDALVAHHGHVHEQAELDRDGRAGVGAVGVAGLGDGERVGVGGGDRGGGCGGRGSRGAG
ncbi:hypothetical protein Q8791_06530, partial [Nocardiopsis sp. CT-R113]